MPSSINFHPAADVSGYNTFIPVYNSVCLILLYINIMLAAIAQCFQCFG
jgi:hypothetical protein